ncbi:hypothetical protein [Mycolicibacterium phlei]
MRSVLAAGAAVVTATALAVAAPDPGAPAPKSAPSNAAVTHVAAPPLRLAAAVESLAVTDLPNLLGDWVQNFLPSTGAAFPQPQLEPLVLGNSIGGFIENAYLTIEPWVEWGFELATYVVGWIPVVGWFAPQIMIFYDTGEQVVQSIVFNFADWIDGQVGFLQGLQNIAVDTINAGIYFINQEIAYWLPPLPPIPPLGGFAAMSVTDELVEPEDTESGNNTETDPEDRAAAFSAPQDEAASEAVSETVVETEPEEIEPATDEEEAGEPVVDDAEPETTSSTGSNGTVSAQGEVRGPVVATPGGAPANAEPGEAPDTGTDVTVTPSAPEAPTAGDGGGPADDADDNTDDTESAE